MVKRFDYRGVDEEYSNTYCLSGSNPANTAAWDAIRTALWALEEGVVPSTVALVTVYGYEVDSDSADYTYHYGTPDAGALSLTGGVKGPGDSAVWARWGTGETNSKGKPIYLRKYYHPGVGTSADLDVILPGQQTGLAFLAAALTPGGSGVAGRYIVGPAGHTVANHDESDYLTTRTLKRRGKRPTP